MAFVRQDNELQVRQLQFPNVVSSNHRKMAEQDTKAIADASWCTLGPEVICDRLQLFHCRVSVGKSSCKINFQNFARFAQDNLSRLTGTSLSILCALSIVRSRLQS
jgi:hypothetical protein